MSIKCNGTVIISDAGLTPYSDITGASTGIEDARVGTVLNCLGDLGGSLEAHFVTSAGVETLNLTMRAVNCNCDCQCQCGDCACGDCACGDCACGD